jgi:hypothetical protein
MTAAELLDKYHAAGFTISLVNREEDILVKPELDKQQSDEFRQQKQEIITEIRRRVAAGGVGTEIKRLLPRRLVSESCECEDYARELDIKGVDWCDKHQDQIAGKLAERAGRLPIGKVSKWANKAAAAGIVLLAIRNAKAKESQS